MPPETPEQRERRHAQRVRIERACALDMAPNVARDTLAETIGAIYCALDDIDAVPERLHPADVVSKHLQRGNMSGDGCDVVPRRPPRETPEDRSKAKTWTLGEAPAEPPAAAEMDPNHAWWQEQAIKAQRKNVLRESLERVASEMMKRQATALDESCATLLRAGVSVHDLELVYETGVPRSAPDDDFAVHTRCYVRTRPTAADEVIRQEERERLAALVDERARGYAEDKHSRAGDEMPMNACAYGIAAAIAAWLRAGAKSPDSE